MIYPILFDFLLRLHRGLHDAASICIHVLF